MKTAYKWRISSVKYIYIIDENENQAFIYNLSTNERGILSGDTVVYESGSEPNENIIKSNVNKMSSKVYKSYFDKMSQLMKLDIDGQYVNLLDWTYYYDVEMDNCLLESEKEKLDVLPGNVNITYNEDCESTGSFTITGSETEKTISLSLNLKELRGDEETVTVDDCVISVKEGVFADNSDFESFSGNVNTNIAIIQSDIAGIGDTISIHDDQIIALSGEVEDINSRIGDLDYIKHADLNSANVNDYAEGEIIQHIGESTATFVNGYFYKKEGTINYKFDQGEFNHHYFENDSEAIIEKDTIFYAPSQSPVRLLKAEYNTDRRQWWPIGDDYQYINLYIAYEVSGDTIINNHYVYIDLDSLSEKGLYNYVGLYNGQPMIKAGSFGAVSEYAFNQINVQDGLSIKNGKLDVNADLLVTGDTEINGTLKVESSKDIELSAKGLARNINIFSYKINGEDEQAGINITGRSTDSSVNIKAIGGNNSNTILLSCGQNQLKLSSNNGLIYTTDGGNTWYRVTIDSRPLSNDELV